MRSRLNSWHKTLTQLGFHRKQRPRRKQSHTRLGIEGLEDRRMLTTVVEGEIDEGNDTFATALALPLGFGAGQDNVLIIEGEAGSSVTFDDDLVDVYEVQLNAGDILGVASNFGGDRLSLFDSSGTELIAVQSPNFFTGNRNLNSSLPTSSPLPQGVASWSRVIDTTGTYYISFDHFRNMSQSSNIDPYVLDVGLYRSPLEQATAGTHQKLFIDFDGGFTSFTLSSGNVISGTVAPLSTFLDDWGLDANQEDAVIDAILATIEENFAAAGVNTDYVNTGIVGESGIEILNSRDHADVFGDPNVSRVVIGSDIIGGGELGLAQSVDVGNLVTEETAVVALDQLAAPSGSLSLNAVNLDPTRDRDTVMIELIGAAVGNVASHEAGHFLGALHTEINFDNPGNLMMLGSNTAFDNSILGEVGTVWGDGNETNPGFFEDTYHNVGSESFFFDPEFNPSNFGTQNTADAIRIGLSTSVSALGAPQVEDVIISGSESIHQPYSFVENSIEPQLLTIPVGGADSITLVFNEAVDASLSDLQVVRLLGDGVINPVSLSQNVQKTRYTWKFAEAFSPHVPGFPFLPTGFDPTLQGVFQIQLSSTLTDFGEQLPLDGDCDDPSNCQLELAPSGDGTPGGDFLFNFSRRPDFDRDGDVDGSESSDPTPDIQVILDNFFQSVSSYAEGDYSGDGQVEWADFGPWSSYVTQAGMFGDSGVEVLSDFNGDGIVDGNDYVVWETNYPISSGATNAQGDADGDGDVDLDDRALWFRDFGETTVDFDSDNDVDGTDFLEWMRNFGTTSGATNADGDANGDGAVDSQDLSLWESNFGHRAGGISADFNADTVVDDADLAIWEANNGMASGATLAEGDSDGDGDVDDADFLAWERDFGLGMNQPLNADFNSDTLVDGNDVMLWYSNNGMASGATTADGDADGDGDVDQADYMAWQRAYGEETGSHDWMASLFSFQALGTGQILVSTLADESDGNYSLGDLSFREALMIAAATSAQDTIVFDANLFSTGTEFLWLNSAMTINSDITILGPGADQLTIAMAWTDRIFTVSPGVTAEISGLTLSEGYAAEGGLIRNEGNLTLTGVELSDSSATNGGAIWSSGDLTIRDSLLQSNGVHNGSGGAVYIQSGDFNAYNSTFYGNYHSGSGYGSAVFVDGGSGHLVNVTVTNNQVFDSTTTSAIDAISYVEVDNSIIAGNTNVGTIVSPDLNFAATASSNNLIGIVEGISFNSTNQTGTFASPLDARLDTLKDNGGPTRTLALLADSPAINQGDTALATSLGLANDQRGVGFDRVLGGSVDIGAYEASLVVTNANDETDGDYSLNDLSLREALLLAANTPGADVITFAESFPSWMFPSSQYVIDTDVSLVGPGSSELTMAMAWVDRAFSIQSGATVAISGLSFSEGGSVQDGGYIYNDGNLTLDDVAIGGGNAVNGGAVYNTSNLDISNSTLQNNSASSSGGAIYSSGPLTLSDSMIANNNSSNTGGGVYQQGSSLAMNRSTIDNNTATHAGGGVVVNSANTVDVTSSTISRNQATYVGGLWSNSSNVDVTNSTISTNTANSGFGGGAYFYAPSTSPKTVTFTNATVANNSAGSGIGGGLFVSGFSVDTTLNNTIVAGNTNSSGADDVYGAFNVASTYNLIGAIDGSMGLTSSTNLTGTKAAVLDAGLTALGDHGGPTETHALLEGSLAIDAGDDAFATVSDQRGEDRVEDGDGDSLAQIDIGAFELAADEYFGSV